MNNELLPLEAFIRSFGLSQQTYADLSKDTSGTPLVSCATQEAFCYDDLIQKIFASAPHSMDAILLKDDLYFIEFKRIAHTSARKDQEILRQSLELKLTDSMIVFYKQMVEVLHLNLSKFKRIAIIVVDYVTSPVMATAGVLSSLSGGTSRMNLTTGNFIYYYQADRHGKRIFYDDIQIWNNINFSVNILGIH